DNRRAAEERKAQLEQAGAKQRHDYGAGMNIMMRYKGINGINAFATNWEGHADPHTTLEDYKQLLAEIEKTSKTSIRGYVNSTSGVAKTLLYPVPRTAWDSFLTL